VILISSTLDHDASVLKVVQLLEQRGADVVVLTPMVLERPSALTIAGADRGRAECILRVGDRSIDLRDVHSAWLWRGWCPDPLLERHHRLAGRPADWRFFNGEWASFHKGLSLLLSQLGTFCVNPPPWNVAFEEKCCQLALAAQAGLTIPPTLFTTCLSVTREFAEAHAGLAGLVYKPFRSFVKEMEVADGEQTRVARLLTNRIAVADLVETEGLVPTPGIFQPYIPKSFELRTAIVGRRLFTCAIHSQQSPRSREDWRRYDIPNTPYVPHELPESVAASLLRLMDRMGLVFGSADMIVTPEGEHVFLEVNPNGQFDFVAKLAGLPIYEHLAQMLISGTPDYAFEEEVAACGSL
jgi:glutathione synthase/RimK-type ligase-like ATP-grasp enzyme